DGELGVLDAQLEQSIDSAQEVAFALQRYASGMEFDPKRLEETERRLDQIQQLKRKYGDSVAAVLAYSEGIAVELGELESGEERRDDLTRRQEELVAKVTDAAAALTAERQTVALRLDETMERHLQALM